MEQLSAQLSAQLDYNNQLLQQLQTLEQEQLDLRRDLSNRDAQIRRLTTLIQESEARVSQLQTQCDAEKRRADNASNVHETHRSSLMACQQSLKDSETAAFQLRNENNALRNEVQQAQRDIQALRISEADLKDALQRNARDAEAARTTIKSLESEKNAAAQKTQAMMNERSSLSAKINDLETQLREERNVSVGLKEQVARLERQMQAQRSDIERTMQNEFSSFVASLKQQNQQFESEIVKVKAENTDLHGLLQSIQSEKAQLIRSLNAEREDIEKKWRTAEDNLKMAEETLTLIESESKQTITQLESTLQQVAQAHHAETQLKDQALMAIQHELQTVSGVVDLQQRHLTMLADTVSNEITYASKQVFFEDLDVLNAKQQELADTISRLGVSEEQKAGLERRVAECELAIEETRQQALHFEGQAAQLKEKLDHAIDQLSNAKNQFSAQVAQIEKENRDREEAWLRELRTKEAFIEESHAQIEALTQRLRILDQDHSGLKRDFADTEAKYRAATADLEVALRERDEVFKRFHEVENQYRNSSMLNGRNEKLLGELKQERAQMEEFLTSKMRQMEADHVQFRDTIERERDAERESAKKTQQQLAQTQALLLVVQEQRKALQEDNAVLRAEIDKIYMSGSSRLSSSNLPAASSSAPAMNDRGMSESRPEFVASRSARPATAGDYTPFSASSSLPPPVEPLRSTPSDYAAPRRPSDAPRSAPVLKSQHLVPDPAESSRGTAHSSQLTASYGTPVTASSRNSERVTVAGSAPGTSASIAVLLERNAQLDAKYRALTATRKQ
jgi:chromosome segregation ATPase